MWEQTGSPTDDLAQRELGCSSVPSRADEAPAEQITRADFSFRKFPSLNLTTKM